jgi:hypothetical protein
VDQIAEGFHIRPDIAKQPERSPALADVGVVMYRMLHGFSEPAEVPGSVSLRTKELLSHVVVYTVDLGGRLVKIGHASDTISPRLPVTMNFMRLAVSQE